MTVRFTEQSTFTRKEFIGLSTDQKPTVGVGIKSTFYETNTGNEYIFDGAEWKEHRMNSVYYTRSEYLAERGFLFGAEVRNGALANDAALFIQIEATTKPLSLVFGAGVEALTHVDSFLGTELTSPATLMPFNYKPSSGKVPTAVVRTATAASALGTPRGNNQTGSGAANSGVGGSTTSRPSTLAVGEKLTLRLTNKGTTPKCVSAGVYWNEIE